MEQRDESPVAVATFFHRLAHIGACREPSESLGHGRVKAADRRKPRRQKRLEDIELPLRTARLNQPFPRFDRRRTPEILERSMSAGEFAGRHAKQQLGRTRVELRSNRTGRSRDLTHIKCRASSADDRVADAVSDGIIDVIEEAQRVVGKPEDQVHAARRQDSLSIGGAPTAARPSDPTPTGSLRTDSDGVQEDALTSYEKASSGRSPVGDPSASATPEIKLSEFYPSSSPRREIYHCSWPLRRSIGGSRTGRRASCRLVWRRLHSPAVEKRAGF